MNRLKLIRCQAILREISEQKFWAPPQIVDLGCGAGWMTAILAHIGPSIGLDYSGEAVKSAREKYPNASFEQVDFREWDPVGIFGDVVVSHEVIEHVEDQVAYLEIARKILKTGGVLIITTPNANTFNAMPEGQRENWSSQPIENLLTPRELRELLGNAGFEVIRCTTVILGYGNRGVRRLLNSQRLRSLLGNGRVIRAMDHFFLSYGYGLHTLIVAAKK